MKAALIEISELADTLNIEFAFHRYVKIRQSLCDRQHYGEEGLRETITILDALYKAKLDQLSSDINSTTLSVLVAALNYHLSIKPRKATDSE